MIWPQCDLGTPWFQVSLRKCLVLRGIYHCPLALPLDQNENCDSPYSHIIFKSIHYGKRIKGSCKRDFYYETVVVLRKREV